MNSVDRFRDCVDCRLLPVIAAFFGDVFSDSEKTLPILRCQCEGDPARCLRRCPEARFNLDRLPPQRFLNFVPEIVFRHFIEEFKESGCPDHPRVEAEHQPGSSTNIADDPVLVAPHNTVLVGVCARAGDPVAPE